MDARPSTNGARSADRARGAGRCPARRVARGTARSFSFRSSRRSSLRSSLRSARRSKPPRALGIAVLAAGLLPFGCSDPHGPPIDFAAVSAVGDDADAPWPPWSVLRRWGEPVVLDVALDAAGGPLEPSALERALRAACEVWSATGLVRLRVVAHAAESSDIAVRWGLGGPDKRSPFGPRPGFAFTRHELAVPEVLLDPEREWSLAPDGSGAEPRLVPTLAHELGHALGLGHTERKQALLSSRADLARVSPAPADLAGLVALYGEPTTPASPGDLSILRAGSSERVSPPLKGLATHGRSAFGLCDADGDGDDELYVWRTDAESDRSLVILDFLPSPLGGPRVSRTYGPWSGLVLPDAHAGPALADDGTPVFLVVRPEDGWLAYRLSTKSLQTWDPATLELDGLPGDADGDGRLDLEDAFERERLARGLQRRVGDLDGDGRREEIRLVRAPADD